MKTRFLILFLLLQLSSFGQMFKTYEQKLNHLIEKRNYWSDEYDKEFDEAASDSLEYYNASFEKYLLKVTSANPQSIKDTFKTLQKNHIGILTSADGNFRIYSWDNEEGGTMRFFRNILQYRVNGKVHSKIYNTDPDDNGCYFYQMDQVRSKNKNFYVTSSVGIGSTADYYYEAKIFSIDNAKLNEEAQLIKTKSGIRNSLGYEIDLTNEANRNDSLFYNKRDYIELEYDKKNKVIIMPLLDENEKITTKKIRYKFNGVYFERMKAKK